MDAGQAEADMARILVLYYSSHGQGQETTLLSGIMNLLHLGYLIVGLPYSCAPLPGQARRPSGDEARRRESPIQSRTMLLKPPQNIRLASKGSLAGSIEASRGSAITLALMRSRSRRDL